MDAATYRNIHRYGMMHSTLDAVQAILDQQDAQFVVQSVETTEMYTRAVWDAKYFSNRYGTDFTQIRRTLRNRYNALYALKHPPVHTEAYFPPEGVFDPDIPF